MKKNILLLAVSFFIFLISAIESNAHGQCLSAGSVSATITTTSNTCASNGTITVNVNNVQHVRLLLIKSGSVVNSHDLTSSPYTFTTLSAGTYEVKGICVNDPNVVYFDQNVTVNEAYNAMSSAAVNVSNVCTSFTPGGTIQVTGVTGGTAPYTYSFVKNTDPAYNDNLSVYTPSSTQNVTEFGTYQIRIKDACGNYITVTRSLAATLPPVRVLFSTLRPTCTTSSFTYTQVQNANTGSSFDFATFLSAGIQMKIQHTDSNGTVVFNGNYNRQTLNFLTSPTHKYYITTTNPCGEIFTYVFDNTANEVPEIVTQVSSSGCPPNEQMTLYTEGTRGSVYPVNVTISTTSGATVSSHQFTAYSQNNTTSLPVASYKVRYVDACGVVLEKTIANPKDTAPSLAITHYLNTACTTNFNPVTQTGTFQIYVAFSGYVVDLDNATLQIISGPSNVGVSAVKLQANRYGWTNVVPGNYTIAVTSCGVTTNYNLTVNTSTTALAQSLTSNATSVCAGGGSISSTKVYNGAFNTTVQLINVNDMNTVIAENTTGNFSNLPAGTYITRMKVTPTCGNGAFNYYVSGNTVTLTGASGGPEVSVSAITCESGSTSSGNAYINISGVTPYTLRYRINGTSTWTTINNVTQPNYIIQNLTPLAVYNLSVVDGCGNSLDNNFTVGVMDNYLIDNNTQPCINQSYTLSGRNYSGAAYEWRNPAGVVVSTTKDYTIANYNTSYDGTYTLKMTWGTCVERTMTVTIYGGLCGMPISRTQASGNVFNDNNALTDNTVNGLGIGTADATPLYVSVLLENSGTRKIITTVKVNSNGTYTVPGLPNTTYIFAVTTNPLGSLTSILPEGWLSTGEHIGLNAGHDGTVNGEISVTIAGSVNVTNVNFGIRKEFCFKPANTSGTALASKFGITSLKRAGDNGNNNNWPMARKGAFMVLEAKNKGFVINRVNTSDITDPVEGMMVYDTVNDCLSIYQNAAWKCLTKKGCPD